MDLRRLRAGEWVAAAAGVALLVSLFLPWYAERSAWQSLAVIDVLLALVAACGVALLLVTATQSAPAVPLAFSVFVVLAGALGLVLVLSRLLSLPEWAEGRDWGIWLALAGALGIVAGGLLGMRDERLSAPDRPTDQTGRPVTAPREVETLPAPRP